MAVTHAPGRVEVPGPQTRMGPGESPEIQDPAGSPWEARPGDASQEQALGRPPFVGWTEDDPLSGSDPATESAAEDHKAWAWFDQEEARAQKDLQALSWARDEAATLRSQAGADFRPVRRKSALIWRPRPAD